MSYENIWEDDGVYRKYNDFITGPELLQAIEDVHGHAKFDSISYVINDLLDVTEHGVTDYDLKRIAAIDSVAARSNPGIKIAVVSTMADIRDMALTYGELVKDTTYICEIFSSMDEAREWVA